MDELAPASRIRLGSLFAPFLLVPLAAGCSGDASLEPSGSSGTDRAETVDAIAVDPSSFRAIAPCSSPNDYVSSGVVFVRGGTCSPRCVRLAAGGTVTFVGSLPAQPVEPRNLGTEPSPIEASRFGGATEFEFLDYGFFPFRCGSSPDAVGVVWSNLW